MGKSISYLSDVFTQRTNTPGVTTPIGAIQPGNGTLLNFQANTSHGDTGGMPIFMDLNDADGNDMPVDTEFVLRVERPTDDEPIVASVKEDNIASWNGIDTDAQRNEENIDAVKIELQADRRVRVRDKDELRFEVNSSATIDWSNSELYLPREAVTEQPFEG